MISGNVLSTPLSDTELDELSDFLDSDMAPDALTLSELDGFLTALAIGPTTIPFSQWQSRIWGMDDDAQPTFATPAQAERIYLLIMRHLNSIIDTLQQDAEGLEPIFETLSNPNDEDQFEVELWTYGFMDGASLCAGDWQPLLDDKHSSMFFTILMLIASEEREAADQAMLDELQARSPLADFIPVCVAGIYRFWLPYRQATVAHPVRQDPKVGRNEACPCGSGKKFKKCCGAAPILH